MTNAHQGEEDTSSSRLVKSVGNYDDKVFRLRSHAKQQGTKVQVNYASNVHTALCAIFYVSASATWK